MSSTSADVQKAQVRAIMRGRRLGRYSAPKWFLNQTFTGGQSVISTPQTNIGTDPPLADLWVVLLMRVVIGTANMTTVAAEAPQTYLTRITLTGTFVGNNSVVTYLDMSGATLWMYQRLFEIRGNSLFFGSAFNTFTNQVEPGTPYQQAGATFGNTGTYDLLIPYRIPMGPIVGPGSRLNTLPYKLRGADWPDGLQVTCYLGDNTAFGTPAGGTTFTYSAWGSGAGTPSYTIYVNRLWLGKGKNGFATSYPAAVLVRREQTVPAGNVANTGNNAFLYTPQKVRTPNIVIKSGLSLAGSPSNVFASLSPFILQNLQYLRGDQAIKSIQDFWMDMEYFSAAFGTKPVTGYGMLSFMEASNPNALLRANEWPAAIVLQVTANIIQTNAANQVNYVHETVLGDPQTRLPGQPA